MSDIGLTMRCYIPEDRTSHNRRCENLTLTLLKLNYCFYDSDTLKHISCFFKGVVCRTVLEIREITLYPNVGLSVSYFTVQLELVGCMSNIRNRCDVILEAMSV